MTSPSLVIYSHGGTTHAAGGTAARAPLGQKIGLHYVYTGNIHDLEGTATRCAGCAALLIERRGYDITRFTLDEGFCRTCKRELPGHFGETVGHWGARRLPVAIEERPIPGEHETG